MERQGDEVHVESTEATGASREGVVRWVLIIGTLLAIILLSVIWMTGAAFQGDVEEEATVSGIIDSSSDELEGDQTDSIVSNRPEFENIGEEEEQYDGAMEVEPVQGAETAQE